MIYFQLKKGPSVLGIIEYKVQGENEFEGAFIATNERLIMNVDMNANFIIEVLVIMKQRRQIMMVKL